MTMKIFDRLFKPTLKWIWIKIEHNESKLGKRYIAKLYRDWKLMASYPANQISDIDLSFLDPNQITTWKKN